MSSRLKYNRKALHINVLPFARYFRQRYAPFIRHRRRSQTVFAIYKINLDNAKNGAIIKTY